MGSTELDSSAAKEKLAKAIIKSEGNLLAESWVPAVKTSKTDGQNGAPEAASGPKVANAKPVKDSGRDAASTSGRSPLQVADAPQNPLRQQVAAKDQEINTAIKANILEAVKDPTKLGDVMKKFDALAQSASQLDLPSVYADYKTIANDPTKKQEAANEAALLHAPGTILANKAIVAYDAAVQPNPAIGAAERQQLLDIARQTMAQVAQDKQVTQKYASQVKGYEDYIKAHPLAPGAAPEGQGAPGTGTDQSVRPQTPGAGSTDTPSVSDADLAKLNQAAQASAAAKAGLEQQIGWGDPNSQQGADKYMHAKADMYQIVNNMDNYTSQQQVDFQKNLFSPTTSVQDKQKFIDSFAANDKNLHDVATDLVKLGGDKLPALASWYNADNANTDACDAFYKRAIDEDKAGNLKQANAYWNQAQNFQLESTFLSNVLKNPDVIALDAKMMGNAQGLITLGDQAAKAGDLQLAAKRYNDSVQAADLVYGAGSAQAQKQVADAQANNRTGDKLTDQDKNAMATLAAPTQARLAAAEGLNSLAAQYTTAADKNPANAAAFKQNADYLNQAAVKLLQDIPKVDPTYGGLTGNDLTLFKQTVADGITSAQKGEVINPAASQKTFLRNAVGDSVSDDSKLLHQATVGPNSATSTAVYGYDAIQGIASKIPIVGSFVPPLPFLPSPAVAQAQITEDLRDAKKVDPVAARTAIDAHTTDLKSTTVNGISTLVSAVAGPKLSKLAIETAAKNLPELAEKYLPEALKKLAPELPGWMKGLAYVGGGLLATVGTNEAIQATAQETLHTKMDSQSKILSESAAAYAAVSLANKIPLSDGKYEAVKFSGVWGNSAKSLDIRGVAGFVPGAGLGLATRGPWSIDPATNKPYTTLQTAKAMAIDGSITGVASMGLPALAQPLTNISRAAWASKNTILAAGAVNTVFGAGDSNPTQINPATGKHYTIGETGVSALENFGTGLAGGYAASRFLPWVGHFAASPLKMVGQGARFIADKDAGKVTAAALDATQKAASDAAEKTPGAWQQLRTAVSDRASALVRPAKDGTNAVRRYLGESVDNASTFVQKHAVTESLKPAAKVVTDKVAQVAQVAPLAPVVAAPVVNKFLAPGTEYLRWKKADADSDKPAQPGANQ